MPIESDIIAGGNLGAAPQSAPVKIPTITSFILRFAFMGSIGAVMGSQILISFNRLAALITPADQKMIARYGVKIGSLGGLAYAIAILLIAGPIIVYIRRVQKGERLEQKYILDVQEKALNIGYKMAIVASLFYILFNPVAFYVGVTSNGWSWGDVAIYNIVGTIICSLIMVPIGVNFGAWSVRHVLNYTTWQVTGDKARRAGWKVNLGFKLFVTFMPIILSLLLYAGTIGYSQTRNIFKNMQAMEAAFVHDEERALLVDEVVHKTDPGVRSSKYFQGHLKRFRTSYIIFMVIGIGGSFVFTILVAAESTRPLRILTQASERIKEGNLDESVHLATTDETAELAVTFNRMMATVKFQMENTEALLGKLRKGIVEIDGTVAAIVSVSSEQAEGATEQAAIAQQASSVAGEFVATAKTIEDRAESVERVANSTLDACRTGEEKLEQTQERFREIAHQVENIAENMDGLDRSFKHIYTIMSHIEGITDQTELLALNASLEAVGAGKSGRRFMVVAEATRRLASRSAEAAKEIKNMIVTIEVGTTEAKKVATQGKEKVASGATAIVDVVDAFRKISSFAESTSMAVKEISITTRQQTTGSQQLDQAVGEILRVAKKVEQGATKIDKTISDLSGFAEILRETQENKN